MCYPTGHYSCSTYPNGPGSRRPKPAFPLCRWIVSHTIGDERTSMNSHCSGLRQYYGGVHAPNDTPASYRNVHDLIGPHNSLPVTTSAYSHRFCPKSDKADQPGSRRDRDARAAHRKRSRRPSSPDEIRGKEERANLDAQVSPTDSKAAESASRIGRAFSIGLLICQLRAIIPHVATT